MVDRWNLNKVLSGREDLLDLPLEERDENREGLLPEKLVLSKARKLIKQGVISGCACGCRGDFEIIKEI